MPSYMYKPGHPFADKSGMVEVGLYYEHKFLTEESKQAMIGNRLITMRFNSDTMAPTQHMADGKMYTSKAAFRQATKRAGCIEVGNEMNYIERHNKQVDYKRRVGTKKEKLERREAIRTAIRQLKERKAS